MVGIFASELTRRLEEVYERVAKNDKLNSFLNDKLNAYFNGVSGVVEKLEEIVDKRLSDFDAAKTSWMLEQARRAACAFPVHARLAPRPREHSDKTRPFVLRHRKR